jgi:hypothetical protein
VADAANHQFFDRYSLVHGALAVVLQASKVPALPAIAGHVIFELGEDALKRNIKSIWPDSRPDAIENHVGDIVSFNAGYVASYALSKSNAGKVALTGFVMVAAGVWIWNLLQSHSWLSPSSRATSPVATRR